MPSARMPQDGALAFVVGDIEKTQHFTIAFQALPWLETAFRYSHVAPGGQLYDRSFGIKARLLSEDRNFADVSVGIRDLLGTGIYSSEYLAASKHIGPVDLTLGMGWGRLAEVPAFGNPFAAIIPSFKVRGAATDPATGGAVNFKQFFHGPDVGIFGGLAWQTPIDGLSLMAEYSSDKYTREASESPKTFVVRSPVNLGFNYRLSDGLSIGGGWYYGSSYGLTLALSTDMKAKIASDARLGPAVPAPVVRSEAQQRQALANLLTHAPRPGFINASYEDPNLIAPAQALMSLGVGVRDVDIQGSNLVVDAHRDGRAEKQCADYAQIASSAKTNARTIVMSDLADGDGSVTFCPIVGSHAVQNNMVERSLRTALAEQGISLRAVSVINGALWLYYENTRYNSESEAIGRIVRVLMRRAPPSIELFHLFPLVSGQPTQEISIGRSSLERAANGQGTVAEIGPALSLNAAPLHNPVLESAFSQNYPRFSWGINPMLGEQFFDPDKPLQIQLLAQGSASLLLAPGLTLGAQVSSTVWSDFKFGGKSDSQLPHVRTDTLQYLQHGATGISYLGVDYLGRLSREVYFEGTAGYLEDMFMGAGGQILWRPEGSRLAIGVDAYQVWQRQFDRLFGIQNYHAFTGHVSFYYESPWYGLNFAVHSGRYLAGDDGVTFEMKRRFSNGAEIGFFATFTNVPAAKYGEGSFDKGIVLRIPLEAALPIFTQAVYNLNLRSLTRDGGQRLYGDDSLFEKTQRTGYNDIQEHQDEIAAP